MIVRSLILRGSGLKPVEKTIRRSRFFRPLVTRFIAGDTLDQAISVSEGLLAKGLFVTLDYLGENTSSAAEADAARRTYIEMLERIDRVAAVKEFGSGPKGCSIEKLNISIKLTQCGLDLGREVAEANYHQVLECAKKLDNFVRIDMEASDYTERTIEIVTAALQKYSNTGTVLQSYLFRTDADVQTMIDLRARVRIVKGAYLEPPSVAYPEKAKVDEAFARHCEKLVREGYYPAVATHDQSVIKRVLEVVQKEGIDKKSFEFQMLYGIQRNLQESLRDQGFNVRIYVPFGDKWYPYFTRRLAERPANTLFILKSLFQK